jgi:alkylation response protein AidB-like acyl-CoA dehydrogenase
MYELVDRRGVAAKGCWRMHLSLSDDQTLFRDTARRFLDDYWSVGDVRQDEARDLGFGERGWAIAAELGWTTLLVPEGFGGGTISGNGPIDLSVVAYELGRTLAAGPVLPTNIVAAALGSEGAGEFSGELEAIAAGQLKATWALDEPNRRIGHHTTRIIEANGGYQVDGTKSPVQDAHIVDLLLVTACGPLGATQALVPVDAPGVTIVPLEGLDISRRFCRVEFDRVVVPPSAIVGQVLGANETTRFQLALALALQCAETVGATDAAYDMTLQYVRDRTAFGRPIGSYQVLKHRLADMLLWLESSKAASCAAIAAVTSDSDPVSKARVAKAYVADRCPAIVRDCLQMHGGIGYTWEHDIHLFLRRVDSNAAVHGGVTDQLDSVADAIAL